MERNEIPFLSVAELGRLLKSREVSPVEATEAYLERIERVDSAINSYITVTHDAARQAAREAEQAISAGHYLGPLHGVPVAVMVTAGIAHKTPEATVAHVDLVGARTSRPGAARAASRGRGPRSTIRHIVAEPRTVPAPSPRSPESGACARRGVTARRPSRPCQRTSGSSVSTS